MEYYVKSVVPIIESNYDKFTTVERNIADFFIQNRKKVDFSSKSISERLFVSEASLSRFAKKCGYRGYREFIYQYEETFVEKQESITGNTRMILNAYQELLNKTYSLVDEAQIARISRYLNQAERVFVCGTGSSGLAAREMELRFMRIGVDIDSLLVSQPDTGEQALDIAEALVRSGALDVIVVDSVAALVPKAEIDGEMGDSHVGLLARLMSQALRKLTAVISKSGTVVIFINQLREKVGVMYGNPETTPGGRALKFFSSVRLDVRRGEVIKNGTELIGNKTKVKVVKNKVAPPFKTAEFDILYGEGISKEGNILDFAVENNIIKKSGAWFSYNGEKIGQGRDNVRKYMVENKEFTAEIDRQVRELLKNNSGYLPSEADDSDNTDGKQPTETETTETTEE